MGLYDNYKISLSNTVKPFAGSVVPELREMKKEMDTAAFKTLDLNLSTQDLLATTPTLDIDKDAYNSLNDEVQTKLDDITNKGDLANSVVDAYNLAHSATRRLNSLASRQKTMEEYKSKLAQAGYTPDVQEYLIHKTEKASGPATFDPRTQRAQPIVPVTPAKQLKDDEILREGVIQVVKSKQWKVTDNDLNSVTFDKDKNSYKINTSRGIEEIPAEDLKNQVDRLFNIKPEWRQSIQQDSESDAYHAHKNISEEQAQAEINNPTTSYGKRAQELQLKERMTAKDALEKAASEQIQMNKVQAFKDYVGGAATRDITLSTATGTTTVDKDGNGGGGSGKGGVEPDENVAVRSSLTAQSNVGAATSTLLQTALTDFQKRESDLLANINEVKNEGQAAKNREDATSYNIAQSKYEDLSDELEQLRKDKAKASERFTRILTRKTTELYPQSSWSTINKTANEKVAKLLKSEPSFKSLNESQLLNITNSNYQLEWFESGETGEEAHYELMYTGIKGPASIKISRPTGEAIKKANQFKDKVVEAAKEDAKLVDQVQTTGLPFNEGASKALKEIVPSAVLYDASNTVNKTKDFVENGIDLKEVEIGQYHPEIDRVSVSIGGTNYLMDVSNARTKQYMASKLLSEKSSPDMQRIGRDLQLDVSYNASAKYEDAFGKGSGVVTKHPLDPEADIILNATKYGIMRVFNSKTGKENYVFVSNPNTKNQQTTEVKIGGQRKTNFTFPEIKSILNNMIEVK